MIANVSAHRRANAFAQALEDQAPQDRTTQQPDAPVADTEQDRLLALAGGLGRLPKPQLDPEVKTVQRAQLVAAMEAMLAEGSGTGGAQVPEQRARKGAHRGRPLHAFRPRSRWSKGLAAGGLTVGVAAGAFSGVAAASSNALPGDSLYGLKRGMENLELGMADDDSDRGAIYLDQASTRMQEARRLMERSRAGDLDHESLGEIRKTLSGMRHDASEGHRLLSAAYQRDGSLGPIQALESFSRSHRDSWRELRSRLPVQLADVSDQVSSVFDAIDEEVGPLKSLLPPAAGHEQSTRGGAAGSSPSRSGHTSRQPQPSSQSPSRDHGHSSGSPRPAESRQHGDSLIGGTGELIDPPHSALPPPSPVGKQPEPDVTIPPLLPGLLPGLGIDDEQ